MFSEHNEIPSKSPGRAVHGLEIWGRGSAPSSLGPTAPEYHQPDFIYL